MQKLKQEKEEEASQITAKGVDYIFSLSFTPPPPRLLLDLNPISTPTSLLTGGWQLLLLLLSRDV